MFGLLLPVLLALVLALLAGAALLAPRVGAWRARPILLELGPNDRDYVQGFREEWERQGYTRFHWTSPSARSIAKKAGFAA